MKRKSTKVPWKLSPAKKNATLHFKEHCTKTDDISLVVTSFFLSKKKQFLNLTQYLLTYRKVLPWFIYIFTFWFLPFFYRFWSSSRLYSFLKKDSKILVRFNVLLVRFSFWICSCHIFYEKFLPVDMRLLLTAKITPDFNNYMLLVPAVQELRSSMHVRRSFWWLIMTLTKLN